MSASFLDTIRDARLRDAEAAREAGTPRVTVADGRAHFAEALRAAAPMAIISEIKRASPSAGAINADLDAPGQALRYQEGGAAAVSVLTEPDHFGGSLEDLSEVSRALSAPTLRKDFILDTVQLDLAALHGASAVLLIVAFLTPDQLSTLIEEAHQRGLTPLVEVHDEAEAEIAHEAGAEVVGVNARNLKTLEVDRSTVLRMGPRLQAMFEDRPGAVFVAESGIKAPEHIAAAHRAGYRAALVGEALVRAPDPGELIRRFVAAARHAPKTTTTP